MSALTQDLIVGLDPTGYTTITGAQLAQLVNSATPETDKGLIIVTTDSSGVPDVPDATTNTKWQKYLWLRISPSTTSFTLCAWNPSQLYNMGYSNESGLTVSTNWNPVSSGAIPAGTIVGSMIASATITKDKIVNIDLSQVNGYSSLLTTSSTPTLSDITATSSFAVGFTIAPLAVDTGKLAKLAVTSAKIALLNVNYTHIAGDGTLGDLLRSKADGSTEWYTPTDLVKSTIPTVTGNALKLIQVNSGATDYQMVASTAVGRTLQQVIVSDATGTSGTTQMSDAALPTSTDGNAYAALDTAITPISATSTLVIEVVLYAAINVAVGNNIGVAVFDSAAGTPTNAVAVGCSNAQASATGLQCIVVRYSVVSGATTARTFSVRFGASAAGTCYATKNSGGAMYGGAIFKSSVKVTEYI